MHNNAPTTERFKPAGHKAQELSEIVLPVEVFPPVQRLIDKKKNSDDKTVGYVFRQIECRAGIIDDIVVSKTWLARQNGSRTRADYTWKDYEVDKSANPLAWFLPSAPLMLEIVYRAGLETTALVHELDRTLIDASKDMFMADILTSTVVRYDYGDATIYHDWSDKGEAVPIPGKEYLEATDDYDPKTEQFLHGLLGKRHPMWRTVFSRFIDEKYDTHTTLLTGGKEYRGECSTRLHIRRVALIKTDVNSRIDYGRCVALLTKFKSNRFEVRDA